MQLFERLEDWIVFRNTLPKEHTLGFAPTMGNLHAGHASLFLASKSENTYTVSSLFINPTQFNQKDDFTHYPRTLDDDINLMAASGVDFCILPTEKAMYPDDFHYQIHENKISQYLEGHHRPLHFQGVLTVVMKLLNLVQPHRAYFGEKDYQQYLLIKGMVKAFFLPVEVKACKTIREPSGLPYSSRNNRLSEDEKQLAYTFAKTFHQSDKPCTIITEELRAQGIKVDYIEERKNRRFAAVHIGKVRLIDTYELM
ncbi:MAG: pantoate--beta-alanine ligase [Legionella sp.]|nr:pantoate--beta-alanine ligase [Legionella sp.]